MKQALALACLLFAACSNDCPPPRMCAEAVTAADNACTAAFGPGYEAHVDTSCGIACRQLRDVDPWRPLCDAEPVDVLCCPVTMDSADALEGGDGGAGGAPTHSYNPGGACPEAECSAFAGPTIGKAMCEDDDPHTADRCVDFAPCGGHCDHTTAQCDALDPWPVQQSACDDGNPCTADTCAALNVCAHAPLPDNSSCNIAGQCVSGTCVE